MQVTAVAPMMVLTMVMNMAMTPVMAVAVMAMVVFAGKRGGG